MLPESLGLHGHTAGRRGPVYLCRARVERIIELDQAYPGLERSVLKRNYRSAAKVLLQIPCAYVKSRLRPDSTGTKRQMRAILLQLWARRGVCCGTPVSPSRLS